MPKVTKLDKQNSGENSLLMKKMKKKQESEKVWENERQRDKHKMIE